MNLFPIFRTILSRPATMQVHTDDSPAPWHRSRENWPSQPPVSYYAPKAEPITDVFDAVIQMLLELPSKERSKLQRLLRHGYRIGIPA